VKCKGRSIIQEEMS